jgi:hypothetical protein
MSIRIVGLGLPDCAGRDALLQRGKGRLVALRLGGMVRVAGAPALSS